MSIAVLSAARPWPRLARPALTAGVFALAAALRMLGGARTQLDPFYDAAVRSMGTSWHAFLVGAFEPSGGVAIDKPPIDLWLQVASTRVLGYGPVALLLPAALGGTLAVVALYDLLNTLADWTTAVVGALALAVLPAAVVTARSDTMDAAMAALVIGAWAVAARGVDRGRLTHAVAAGALIGLAFEVKLFEALVGALPLALFWVLAARRRRVTGVAAAVAAAVVCGLAWLVAAPHAPWAIGSTHGSAWDAAFVYDGWDRIAGGRHAASAAGAARVPAPPGPWRLFSGQDGLAGRLGLELAAAWAALVLTFARGDRRAGVVALGAWLGLGTVLFSLQAGMRPRYLEAFTPAVAACLALGVRGARPAWLPLAAVLAASLTVSTGVVRAHAQDSGAPGALPAARVARLSAFLRARQHGARYELASVAPSPAAPIIAGDGRPVLVLTAAGHEIVSAGRLSRLVAAGAVHDALVPQRCTDNVCTWIRSHGRDVSRAAGQPHAGRVYAL